ncbi:MAG: hypothetical protein WBN22_01450, partial [Verrucomicrobiia bacterium]
FDKWQATLPHESVNRPPTHNRTDFRASCPRIGRGLFAQMVWPRTRLRSWPGYEHSLKVEWMWTRIGGGHGLGADAD